MWILGNGSLYHIDAPFGPDAQWVLQRSNVVNNVLALGGDTLLTAINVGQARSLDRGLTFTVVPREGTYAIVRPVVIPFGIPFGGTIVASAQGSNAFGTYSRDRGASWHSASIPNSAFESPTLQAMTVVTRGPRAGRVVAGGGWGIATSDDGGATYRQVPGYWEYFRYTCNAVGVVEGGAANGGDRVLALLNWPGHTPDVEVLVAASDDGGDTWFELSELRGDPNYSAAAVVDFGARRVLAVMLGGQVWASTDAGATWTLAGIVEGGYMDPGQTHSGYVHWAFRGEDDRLYVGGSRLGNSVPGWTLRTVDPVTFAVAGEAPPTAPSSFGISARPNPAGSRASVVLRVAEAGAARVVVVDALGREVAIVLDGAVSAGETAVPVETGTLPAGVYVVRAAVGGRTATARLVVAR